MTLSNITFSIFSGIGLILSFIPLWWHLESWNVGPCMFMIWTLLACFVFFVDSIVWSGNAINWIPVWCDIAVRIQIGVVVAWPACALCIIRRLHNIACSAIVVPSRADKRRRVIIDLLITVGIPVCQMGLELLVAGHRFTIIEDFGCFPATSNTPLTYVLVWSWPLIIGIISACYGALTIRSFIKRRRQFRDLITANTSLTYGRYWRLIAMTSADFCLTIPLTVKTIITNLLLVPRPQFSWAAIHAEHSRVIQVPRVILDQDPAIIPAIEFTRWAAVLSAFVFFSFFGFADEAIRNYRLLAAKVAKRLGYTTQSTVAPDSRLRFVPGPGAAAPLSVLIIQETESKKDYCLERFSTATIIGDYGPKDLPYRDVEQLASTDSLDMTYVDHEVPQVPEPVYMSAPPPYGYI